MDIGSRLEKNGAVIAKLVTLFFKNRQLGQFSFIMLSAGSLLEIREEGLLHSIKNA